jgi:hypothetical protein
MRTHYEQLKQKPYRFVKKQGSSNLLGSALTSFCCHWEQRNAVAL